MSDFWLQKWYVDVVDSFGNVYIGYWGEVRWKAIRLHFFQHLFRTAARGVCTSSGLKEQPEPRWSAPGVLEWSLPGVVGIWRSDGVAPIDETLIESEEGTIRWRCHQPKAYARVETGDLAIEGWGYSECIEITIPAWRLPLKRLYWGRAHSASHHMVWIQWEGEPAFRRLWHDGAVEGEFAVSESGVSGRAATLMIDENATLRQGTVRSTVFGAYESVAALFPAQTLLFDEHKWYGTGSIFAANGVEPATAIHEVVTW